MDTPIYDQLFTEVDFDPVAIGTRPKWSVKDFNLKWEARKSLARAAEKAAPAAAAKKSSRSRS